MSTRFDDYQKVLKNERFHREIQSAMMAAQTALMMEMSGSLNNLQAEMDDIRQLSIEGLAIQQEMLQRERFQGHLEEFIYNTEKMVTAFSDKDCDASPSARYFSLRGVLDTVNQLAIGTAVIRGRENKAAFESVMESVKGLLGELKTHPEVIEAVDWAKLEQQRIAEQQQQALAKRQELLDTIGRLAASRKAINPFLWYDHRVRPALAKIYPGLADVHPLLFVPASFVLTGGVVPAVLALWQLVDYKQAEREINAKVDGEIAQLRQQLASM